MQWIKLHTTELFKGSQPLLILHANKNTCSECKGVKVLGKCQGLAYCNLLNEGIQSYKFAKNTHICMDERITRELCLKEGKGCPIRINTFKKNGRYRSAKR